MPERAAEGVYLNVLINLAALAELDGSEDPDFGSRSLASAQQAFAAAREQAESLQSKIRAQLEDALT